MNEKAKYLFHEIEHCIKEGMSKEFIIGLIGKKLEAEKDKMQDEIDSLNETIEEMCERIIELKED